MQISPAGRRGQAGFSLFEILVVLVLLGLAATLVLPALTRGMAGLELEAAARDMVTLMKKARSDAVTEQKVMRVILEEKEQKEEGQYVLANEYEQPIKTFSLPDGVRIVPVDRQERLPVVISFYPNGRSSGGNFVLKRETGRSMWIEVDPITGYGKVFDKAEESR